MAQPSTLFRFRVDLSDVDRGLYQALDFRIAMHPSETAPYLLCRVLAYALNIQDGLEFTPGGLSDPDAPALRINGGNGGTRLWIEIGNPSSRKLHKASKAADLVKVYTYKDAEALLRDARINNVHKASEIEIYSFASDLLERLAATLARDNSWGIVVTDGTLMLSIGDLHEQIEMKRHYI